MAEKRTLKRKTSSGTVDIYPETSADNVGVSTISGLSATNVQGALEEIVPQLGGGSGGTPYVTTISSWSGSKGNYHSTINASTHGKGTYPSVHTYVRNGSLWEETYDSPGIDDSGNVTVYTNSVISIKVVIK